ncbi:MAG: hypothetical protein K9G49_07535 [Taibaiella sp.]|nr:hypothetical protein [Taibaiella sp.]
MRTNQLSREEFKSTMSGMVDVTEIVDAAVDIWEYAAQLVNIGSLPKVVYDDNIVEYVYRNDSVTFDHVLLPTGAPNVFVVVVVDLVQKSIYGHYPIDLSKEYGQG